jgi:Domain of unknown function (DUF4142)
VNCPTRVSEFPEKNRNEAKEENEMKAKLISSFITVAVVAGGFSLVVNVLGQGMPAGEEQDFRNPYLRPHPSATPQNQASKLTKKDQQFLLMAAAASEQAAQDSRVAEKKGNAAVQKVASQIAAMRSQAADSAVKLAKKKGLGITTDNIKPRNMGSNFDRQYLYSMEMETEQDIRAFEKQARTGDDKDIKSWAAKEVPAMKANLSVIKRARGKEG